MVLAVERKINTETSRHYWKDEKGHTLIDLLLKGELLRLQYCVLSITGVLQELRRGNDLKRR